MKPRVNTVSISVTNKCNFYCKHCSVDAGVELCNKLEFKEIIELLKNLKKFYVKKIELTGGEPLLRKDLDKIIKFAKKLNYKTKVLTNGSLLSKNKIISLKKAGLDEIAISLDGADFLTYKKLRPVSREIFFRVLRNIKLASSSGIFIKINTVLINSNMNSLQKIINFCEKYKIKEMRICYFTKKGRGKNLNEVVDSKIWLKFLKKLKTHNINLYAGFSYANFHSKCMINKEIPLYISSIGNMHMCPLLKPIGNIRIDDINSVIKKINLSNFKSCLSQKYSYKGLFPVCPLKKFKLNEFPGT